MKTKLFLVSVMLLLTTVVQAQDITVAQDNSSSYTPTQIVNGDFSTEPWMDYEYGGNKYTAYPTNPIRDNVTKSYPNGVNGGWNTTETWVYQSLFEWSNNMGTYNPTLNTNGNNNGHEGFVEMNAQNPAVLYQDLTTYSNDVIRWTLDHAVRTASVTDATQSMKVGIGAPERDVNGNIIAASGTGDDTNARIIDDTEAFYQSTGYTGHNGYDFGHLGYLSLSTTGNNDNWYTVKGVYCIPEGQTVTRFAFISTNATQKSLGNLLDNITFSTLIGNLSATHNADGTATLKGYWGETDDSKQLVIKIGSTTYNVDMTSVEGKNFVITIPAATIGTATTIEVYHQDYVAAKRSVEVPFIINAHAAPQNAGVYYSTFYSEVNQYQLPEDVEAYIGTINGSYLTLTKIADEGEVLPTSTAVILKSTLSNYKMYASATTPVTSTGNDLAGVATTTTISGSTYEGKHIYTLAAVGGVVGFYKYTGSTLAAHKAFLALNAAVGAARGFAFNFDDETTSINEELSARSEGTLSPERMKNEEFATAEYYDLQGRLINKPAKGLYVKDGKKVVVR